MLSLLSAIMILTVPAVLAVVVITNTIKQAQTRKKMEKVFGLDH